MDLASNNLLRLICHKNPTNQPTVETKFHDNDTFNLGGLSDSNDENKLGAFFFS